jgi:hypothetical protein
MSYSTGMHHAPNPNSAPSKRMFDEDHNRIPNWKRSLAARLENEVHAVRRELGIERQAGLPAAIESTISQCKEREYSSDELRAIAKLVVYTWLRTL